MPEELPWDRVALASTLVLMAGGLSLALRLRLEGQLAIAALRATAQLFLVGFVLESIFADGRIAWTVAAMVAMVLLAAQAATKRTSHRMAGTFFGTALTLGLCAGTTAVFGGAIVLGADPWYAPQFAIPLLGMMLGNGLTGVSLSLDTLQRAFHDDGDRIEAELALGASRLEALRRPFQRAIRQGLTPIINVLTVAGVVSLPGMMTGQILAGVPPAEAIKVQLVVLFLIAGATAFACFGAALFAGLRLIDAQGRVRSERLRPRR